MGGGALMQLVLDKDKGLHTVKDLKGKTVTVLAYQDTTYFLRCSACSRARA